MVWVWKLSLVLGLTVMRLYIYIYIFTRIKHSSTPLPQRFHVPFRLGLPPPKKAFPKTAFHLYLFDTCTTTIFLFSPHLRRASISLSITLQISSQQLFGDSH
ncbi:uncharacterized protein TEOVI_000810700 [Trypanosoma equiperdum]|uniref:Uncharacterized protein n=2 Tax=Trypanozoon TaxID=39700 RepID=Q38E10_TRYB2|nr:hypothetical protein, unlikely [Trypanosoma brucei brucei TREU927]EAN76960.1 hypothetical protein, unlikely [Trypanosoma brucei brucei TREU927]SCU64849.1 hypothetical protein, conserved [Trypanosoma equiperdum]